MAEIETVGLGIHWEDLPVGRRFKTIGRTITEADLVAFVNCTGMVEVLFTNTEFLRTESAIKQRVVPGALCRESGKRPGMGLVRTRNRVVKQDGTEVLVYTPLRMVKGRSLKKG